MNISDWGKFRYDCADKCKECSKGSCKYLKSKSVVINELIALWKTKFETPYYLTSSVEHSKINTMEDDIKKYTLDPLRVHMSNRSQRDYYSGE